MLEMSKQDSVKILDISAKQILKDRNIININIRKLILYSAHILNEFPISFN